MQKWLQNESNGVGVEFQTYITSIFLEMDSCRWGPTLEDALTPKSPPVKIFVHVKEIGTYIKSGKFIHKPNDEEELLAWKPGKNHIP